MFSRISPFPGIVFGICVLLCSCTQAGYAQVKTAIFVHGGYSTFQLNQLRDYNANILNVLPVEGRLVSDFPGYFTYSGSIQCSFESVFAGLYAGHSSTGSRISYRDYSGYIRFDQTIRTNSLGAEFGASVFKRNNFALNLSLGYLANFNSLAFVSESKVPGDIEYMHLAFDSFTHGIQPTVSFTQKIGRFIGKLEGGYEAQFPGRILLSSDHNAYLMDDAGEEVLFKGSGTRWQAGIGYQLFP